MRGVPRARRAISCAPAPSTSTPRMPAARADDRLEVGDLVVVEPRDETEAIAQRPGDRAGACGGADEREAREVESDRPRRRSLAEHDVELEVLHRRVEHLLDRAWQAMDLVDEQHVALVELGEDRGEVAGALERGSRGDLHLHAELDGDDAGERGLAQTRADPRTAGGRTPGDRRRAASRMIDRWSFTSPWPTNSARCRGRRLASAAISSSAGSGASSSSLTTSPAHRQALRGRRAAAAPRRRRRAAPRSPTRISSTV